MSFDEPLKDKQLISVVSHSDVTTFPVGFGSWERKKESLHTLKLDISWLECIDRIFNFPVSRCHVWVNVSSYLHRHDFWLKFSPFYEVSFWKAFYAFRSRNRNALETWVNKVWRALISPTLRWRDVLFLTLVIHHTLGCGISGWWVSIPFFPSQPNNFLRQHSITRFSNLTLRIQYVTPK